jgi:outer membrane murein-binding lipoprotein Lpp
MNTIVKNMFAALFAVLALVNVYIFVAGMYLADDINRYETEIETLSSENVRLEKEVYQAQSLQYAASLSAHLNFTKKSTPVYFESLKYAFAQ